MTQPQPKRKILSSNTWWKCLTMRNKILKLVARQCNYRLHILAISVAWEPAKSLFYQTPFACIIAVLRPYNTKKAYYITCLFPSNKNRPAL